MESKSDGFMDRLASLCGKASGFWPTAETSLRRQQFAERRPEPQGQTSLEVLRLSGSPPEAPSCDEKMARITSITTMKTIKAIMGASDAAFTGEFLGRASLSGQASDLGRQ